MGLVLDVWRAGLLPNFPRIVGGSVFAGTAKRVDIEPDAPGVTGINGQRLWRAMFPDVDKHAFHALLVELIVIAE